MLNTVALTHLPLLSEVPGVFHGFEEPVAAQHRTERDVARSQLSRALQTRGTVHFLRQVHGACVASAPWRLPPEADAAVADSPGQILAIETADCLPLLIVDPAGPRVAAVHAGWRGSVLGVAAAAVSTLVARGAQPDALRVGLGPAIGPCCYQVGREVVEAFGTPSAAGFRADGPGHWRLDLAAVNRGQLEAVGVRPEHISVLDECTRCSARGYPSYRRDGVGAGRLFSLVGLVD